MLKVLFISFNCNGRTRHEQLKSVRILYYRPTVYASASDWNIISRKNSKRHTIHHRKCFSRPDGVEPIRRVSDAFKEFLLYPVETHKNMHFGWSKNICIKNRKRKPFYCVGKRRIIFARSESSIASLHSFGGVLKWLNSIIRKWKYGKRIFRNGWKFFAAITAIEYSEVRQMMNESVIRIWILLHKHLWSAKRKKERKKKTLLVEIFSV